jgi:hypothetical protein
LAGALIGLGIFKDSVLRYETALKADKFLLVAHATGDELARARDILARTAAASLDQHSVEA